MRSAVLLTVVLGACTPAPSDQRDGAAALDAAADGATAGVAFSRSFGQEGETPTHLVAAGDRLLALTDRAAYQLDHDGRLVRRSALPAASSGSYAVILDARWDGSGLGAVVRWGQDTQVLQGTYLALSDRQGSFTAASMLSLTSLAASARLHLDGTRHGVAWIEGTSAKPTADLRLATTERTKPILDAKTLLAGLPSTAAVGGWSGAALCTVEPAGVVKLRTFSGASLKKTLTLNDAGRRAVGPCRLASSGRSQLVVWTREALPPDQIDAGPYTKDLGPGTLTYDVPVAQLVDPQGQALPRSVRLSIGYQGPVEVQAALWDPAAGRYLVLFNPVGFRGGRLVLTALDEAGKLLYRDGLIPLADYEPGRTVAGRLAVTSVGQRYLLYSIRRPWDDGVLYLAKLEVDLQ